MFQFAHALYERFCNALENNSFEDVLINIKNFQFIRGRPGKFPKHVYELSVRFDEICYVMQIHC